MHWQLAHHFLNPQCDWGVTLVRGRLGRRRKAPSCPHDHGSIVSSSLAPAITELLRRRGIDYDPAGPSNAALWCLGGPELYRNPDDVEDLEADICLDLNLRVCDEHQMISLELYPYDLVPESGGSGPDDPRRSHPIEIGETEGTVDDVLARLDAWLDQILILPG